jgi:hypothetical protein
LERRPITFNPATDGYEWSQLLTTFEESPSTRPTGRSRSSSTWEGQSELKATFNYRRQINDSATGWPGDQIYGYTAYAYVVRNVRTIYKTQYYSGTLGDTLTAGNLTINAGVRYDVQLGKNLPSSAPGNPLVDPTTGEVILPPVIYQGDPNTPFNYKDWQPRVSAAYSLGKNHTTQLRGSYARYADQLGFVTYQANGLSQTSGYYYYWNDSNGDNTVTPDEIDFTMGAIGFYPMTRAGSGPGQPDLTQPRLSEDRRVHLRVDQQITNDFALSATYTYRHVKDLQYRLPIRASANTWALKARWPRASRWRKRFTLPFNVPFYELTLEDSRSGTTSSTGRGDPVLQRALSSPSSGSRTSGCSEVASAGATGASRPPEAVVDPNNCWNLAGQNTNDGLVVGYSGKTTSGSTRGGNSRQWMHQLPLGINFPPTFRAAKDTRRRTTSVTDKPTARARDSETW